MLMLRFLQISAVLALILSYFLSCYLGANIFIDITVGTGILITIVWSPIYNIFGKIYEKSSNTFLVLITIPVIYCIFYLALNYWILDKILPIADFSILFAIYFIFYFVILLIVKAIDSKISDIKIRRAIANKEEVKRMDSICADPYAYPPSFFEENDV
jgi:hypothetical protein